jgi:hypothetical protein
MKVPVLALPFHLRRRMRLDGARMMTRVCGATATSRTSLDSSAPRVRVYMPSVGGMYRRSSAAVWPSPAFILGTVIARGAS